MQAHDADVVDGANEENVALKARRGMPCWGRSGGEGRRQGRVQLLELGVEGVEGREEGGGVRVGVGFGDE